LTGACPEAPSISRNPPSDGLPAGTALSHGRSGISLSSHEVDMPAPKTAQDVLVTELKEIHSAERQFSRTVPKLSRAISSQPLKDALQARREQGAGIIEELDSIFEDMGVTKARPKNVAAEGLIEDMNEHLEEIDNPALLDAVLLGAVQKLEHYCIAAWGTSASLGRLLNQPSVVTLMERLVVEGKRDDEALTQLAESEINPAMVAGEEAGEDEEVADEKVAAKPKGKASKKK
jgi:ferritin-like metal-binding protein YciE